MEVSLEDLRRAWALLLMVKIKQMCRDGGVLAPEQQNIQRTYVSFAWNTLTQREQDQNFKFKGDTSISSYLKKILTQEIYANCRKGVKLQKKATYNPNTRNNH